MGALLCELEREGLPRPPVVKDVLGIRGTQLYTVAPLTATMQEQAKVYMHTEVDSTRGGGQGGVSVLFKQVPELQTHHSQYMARYASHFLEERGLRGLLLVLQAGTWYHQPSHLLAHVHTLLEAALTMVQEHARQRRHVTLVWAEQVAQHWPTSNGYFVTAKSGGPLKLLCPALANSSAAPDWRNDLVWAHYLAEGTPWRQRLEALAPFARLGVLSFRAVTRDQSSMHMRQQVKDCTHLCYSPLMYQPIYRQLAELASGLAKDVAATADHSGF